ncbi:DUF342 domain-containing protein [Alkalihalobacillus trypoxylicola]|uniref:Flagellar Assembly Protein A N-terminal region domain-containing protein n=1 Tax=Alkalihalobacillus trypoxylicola TaxID=519424 RepID=A0A162F8G2_9BACI|nr:FapA family protein [Alkalihalobacillus trypoxylicola]KYG35035.1 hypothetical protein AZF04_01485 [Alkalihalobacillus trypoxylicola]
MLVADQYFSLQISADKMQAWVRQEQPVLEDQVFNLNEISQFIEEGGIQFGIDAKVLDFVFEQQTGFFEPQCIATGKEATRGKDATLKIVAFTKEEGVDQEEGLGQADLKKVIEIPSVIEGQKLAQKIRATEGEPGKNVLGEEIPAKRGKDFTLRPGKNTRLDNETDTLYALINGQMSVNKKTVHVYPIYEIKGDMGTKTGNISFVGNVVIRGNVPTGFKIEAGGDIRIMGTVEGAELKADGSIFVGAGIVGQKRSSIYAKGSLQTTFINEGHVEVEDSIYVTQSILHSHCYAGQEIVCTRGKGNIVGGSISAGFKIQANEFGNGMHTKTELYIGPSEQTVSKQKELEIQLHKWSEERTKTDKLMKLFAQKEQTVGPLMGSEKIQKLRVQHHLNDLLEKEEDINVQLQELKELTSSVIIGFIKAERMAFPNVNVHFGKYRRKLTSSYPKIQVSLIQNEITISTLT